MDARIRPRLEKFEIAGHHLSVVVDGRDRFEAMIDVIDQAAVSLKLYYYICEADASGRRFVDSVIAARKRGVSVCFLVDGFGTMNQPDAVYRPLVEAGVGFARFLPRYGAQFLVRNHQKMLIADDRIAVIGGSNISDAYFSGRDGWRDLLLKVEGLDVARLSHYHDALASWINAPKHSLRGLRRLLAAHSRGKGHLRWLHGGPFRRLSPMTHALRRDIELASHVDMIEAYFAPNWGMLRKLGGVARRGHVRLITAAKSDNRTTISAARHCYRRLLRNGTEIREYQTQKLHMKLIVADNAVYIGSANFDMRSLYLNVELLLRIEDHHFAAAMRALIDQHASESELIDAAKHKQRSSWFSRLRWLGAYFLFTAVDYGLTRNLSVSGD
jgi:cardiolipin synthase A/B